MIRFLMVDLRIVRLTVSIVYIKIVSVQHPQFVLVGFGRCPSQPMTEAREEKALSSLRPLFEPSFNLELNCSALARKPQLQPLILMTPHSRRPLNHSQFAISGMANALHTPLTA
jgi:hypothetical protein